MIQRARSRKQVQAEIKRLRKRRTRQIQALHATRSRLKELEKEMTRIWYRECCAEFKQEFTEERFKEWQKHTLQRKPWLLEESQ